MFRTGAGHAEDFVNTEVCDVAQLERALKGWTVIAAHAGIGNFFDLRPGGILSGPNRIGAAAPPPLLRQLRSRDHVSLAKAAADFAYAGNNWARHSRQRHSVPVLCRSVLVSSLLEKRNHIEPDYQLKRAYRQVFVPRSSFDHPASLWSKSQCRFRSPHTDCRHLLTTLPNRMVPPEHGSRMAGNDPATCRLRHPPARRPIQAIPTNPSVASSHV